MQCVVAKIKRTLLRLSGASVWRCTGTPTLPRHSPATPVTAQVERRDVSNYAAPNEGSYHPRQGFGTPKRFEVRHRCLPQTIEMFTAAMSPTTTSIDCFFDLELQASDIRHVRRLARIATMTSEKLKRMAKTLLTWRWWSTVLHSTKAHSQTVARSAETAAPRCERGQ